MACAAVSGGASSERSAVAGTAVAGKAGEGTGEASHEVAAVTGVIMAGGPEEFNERGAAVVDVPGSSVPEKGSP